MTLIFVAALFSATTVFAQADDAAVAGWVTTIDGWFSGAAAPEGFVKEEITAAPVVGFDAATADFDAEWNNVAGEGNVIGKEGSRMGMAASENGAADFTGAFKVMHDDANIYILLKYTDDDVTGSESVEVCVAPYLKVSTTEPSNYWFSRFVEFGAYKASFKNTGFNNAMLINGAAGTIDWGGSPAILTDNLYLDDKTVDGAGVVKQIITIGFASLTGSARPTFDVATWEALEGGKGITFDIKVNDVDMDDALNAADEPVAAPAEYWWNTTNNDCWQSNDFAGFLAPGIANAVKSVQIADFFTIDGNMINLKNMANVSIFTAEGKLVRSEKNVNSINVSTLNKGVFVIRANNQILKIVR